MGPGAADERVGRQVARAESAAQRARAAADEQARKAAAALRQAEAAEAAVEQLERLLARSRARLSQESAAQRRESDGRGVSPGVSPGTRPRQDLTLQEPPQQGAQMRMGATDFKGTFQVSRLPKLVVLELEGGTCPVLMCVCAHAAILHFTHAHKHAHTHVHVHGGRLSEGRRA